MFLILLKLIIEIAGVKNFVRNKSYEAELELLMPTLPTTDANDPNIGPECSSGCVICDRNPQLEGLYGV